MRSVIKQGLGADQVRAIGGAMAGGERHQAQPMADRADVAEAEIARLRERIVALEAAVSDAGRLRERAVEEGRRLREDDRAALLDRLSSGIAAATAEYAAALASLERLAPLIARAGIERVLGDSADRAAVVVEAVREQLTRIQEGAVLQVEVSPKDFPGEAQLSALAAAIVTPRGKVAARDGLASGECRFRLTLGALEVGPVQQWRVLDGLLSDLAIPGVRS